MPFLFLLRAFPNDLIAALSRRQNNSIVRRELVSPHGIVADLTRVDIALAMVRDRVCALVNGVGAEIGDVACDGLLRLIWRGLRSGILRACAAGHHLRGHVPEA